MKNFTRYVWLGLMLQAVASPAFAEVSLPYPTEARQTLAKRMRRAQNNHPIVLRDAQLTEFVGGFAMKDLLNALKLDLVRETQDPTSYLAPNHILNPIGKVGLHPILVCAEKSDAQKASSVVYFVGLKMDKDKVEKYVLAGTMVDAQGKALKPTVSVEFPADKVKTVYHETHSLFDGSSGEEGYALFYQTGLGNPNRPRDTYQLTTVVDIRLGQADLDTCVSVPDGEQGETRPSCSPRVDLTCQTPRSLMAGGPWVVQ